MNLSLADELVLLAYDDHGHARLSGTNLELGLGGALLLEFGAHRPGTGRRQAGRGHRPHAVGNVLVDRALAQIRGEGKSRKPKDWVANIRGRSVHRG